MKYFAVYAAFSLFLSFLAVPKLWATSCDQETNKQVWQQLKDTLDISKPCKQFFKEPLLDFKLSKQEIKDSENRHLLIEGAEELIYEGEPGQERIIIYQFKGEAYKGSTLLLRHSQTYQEILDYLHQKHIVHPTQENTFAFEGNTVKLQDGGALGLKLIYTPRE